MKHLMCLGVPGRILEIQDDPLRTARVQFGGVIRDVALIYLPEAQEGDWILVHAGIGIRRLDVPAEGTDDPSL